MAKGPEAKVKDDIRAYLKSIGAYQFWPVQMGMGAATVDCLACWKGQFFAIEVKRPDTRPEPTPRQGRVLHEVETAGGVSIVAFTLADVEERLWT